MSTLVAISPGTRLHRFSSLGVMNAPRASGVYALCDEKGHCLDVGESTDIRRRLQDHLAELSSCVAVEGAAAFAYELVAGAQRLERQDQLIRTHRPPCN